MKIYDRGLLGNDKVEIKDVETIQKIGNLINSSTNISDADANLKINRGLCMLDIVFRDDKITEINVVTTVTGGIITSGQFCYRSDSLLSIIIQELNNNSPKK